MRKSSKNSKESTSREIDRAFNEDVEIKLKGKSKKTGCSRTRTGSSSGASKARRTCMAKMNNFKRSQYPSSDFDSDVDDFEFDWMNFPNRRAYFPEESGEV